MLMLSIFHQVKASAPAAAATGVEQPVLAVDGKDALQRVIVDARLMQATRRCQLLWRRLQEHGGIHDSHAERLLATDFDIVE